MKVWGEYMRCKILVVDDVAVNRAIMKVALNGIEDVEFIEATNGIEVLKIVNEQEISLVILDLVMPLKDGFEVLKEMKSTPSLQDIPVIVYSGNEDVDSVGEALELGAYDYFTKPLKPREMKVVLPKKARNALRSFEQQKTIQSLNLKMQVDLLMASILQQSLLRDQYEMTNAMMYGKYIPTQDIGGDFYECIEVNNTIWFIMADMSGDGVAAAMLTSMLKVEFQNCIKTLDSPDKVLKVMNNTFCKMTQGNYSLTAFVGMIRDYTLWYSNAGQPCPLVFHTQQQKIEILRENNLILGMAEDEKYLLSQMKVAPGDLIITYTQGLIEDKLMSDSVGVYDELANCIVQYLHIIETDVEGFFNIIFRLFGNVSHEKVGNDVAMMLISMK